MRRFLSILALLPTLALAADPATAPSSQPPLKITLGKDTTRITSPLRPDGSVDYIAAINTRYSKNLTPENNAAIPLIKIFGPSFFPDETRNRAFAALQIASFPPEGKYFIPYRPTKENEHLSNIDSDLMDFVRTGKHTESHDQIVTWIKANNAAFDAAVEAVKRDRFFIPFVTKEADGQLLSASFPQLGYFRALSCGLSARAAMRISEGNIDAAISDLQAAYKLGCLVTQRPTLLDQLVGLACSAMVMRSSPQLIASPALTAKQAMAYAEFLRKNPLPDIAEPVDGFERLANLDWIQRYARQGMDAIPPEFSFTDKTLRDDFAKVTPEARAATDWNAILRAFNDHTDRQLEALRLSPFEKRRATIAELDAQPLRLIKEQGYSSPLLKNADAPTRNIDILFQRTNTYALEHTMVLSERAAAFSQLAQVALALAAYRIDHKTYPDTLASLQPDYLAQIPNDRFIDAPFHYVPHGKDGFLLYSVNDDMKDHGGTDMHDKDSHFDLLLRIGK